MRFGHEDSPVRNVGKCDGESWRLSFPIASRILGFLEEEALGDSEDGLPVIPGYHIHRLLAAGGGGEVYLAFRRGGSEALAIKLLNRSLGSGRLGDDRAWRELDLLSEMRIPGVPTLLDYGIAGGRLYLVAPRIEGLTLDQYCLQRRPALEQRVEVLAKVADIVQTMHEHGVIHRDIKPENIIVQHDGRPVIIDLGIAALLDRNAADSITLTGIPIGTIGFMPPEQARGERASTRSDVYGLGALACFVLTGSLPHEADTALHEAIRRIAHEPARDPHALNPSLPKALAQIIAKALSFDAQARYPSAALLAEDLRRWVNHEVIPWQRLHWFNRQLLAVKRNPRVYLARTAFWLLLLGLLGASFVAVDKAAAAREQERQAAHWESEARKYEVFRNEVVQREKARIALRERQIARVKAAAAKQELLPASLDLLNIAEEIRTLGTGDEAEIELFIRLMNEVFDAAAAQDAD